MLLVLFGLIVGTILGITGAGGALFALPMLVYGAKIHVDEALFIAIVTVCISACIGTFRRLGSGWIDVRTGLIVAVTGAASTKLGSHVSRQIPSSTLLIGFALLMVVVAGVMLCKTPSYQRKTRPLLLILVGLVAGFLSGLFSIGGGFIIVPALATVGALPMQKAVATSLFSVSIVSFFASLNHWTWDLHLSPTLLLAFVGASCAGMLLGTQISAHFNQTVLKRTFSALIIVASLLILSRETGKKVLAVSDEESRAISMTPK